MENEYNFQNIKALSFFANPFGLMQRQEECRVLIDRIFDKLYEEKIPVGGSVYKPRSPG